MHKVGYDSHNVVSFKTANSKNCYNKTYVQHEQLWTSFNTVNGKKYCNSRP